MNIYSIDELTTIDFSEAVEALTQDVTYILTGLAEVPVDKAHGYYQAVATAYKETEDMFEAIEQVHEDESMAAVNNDLYNEFCDRCEIPKEPSDELLEIVSEAWDDGLEMVIMDGFVE